MMKKYLVIIALLINSAYADHQEKKIQLLPHQIAPIKYLQEHPEQKGILINHYMGTGKTYLALGMSEAFADKKIVIIAPRFIEGHWQQHVEQFNVVNKSRYEFLSYHNAPDALLNRDLSNTIVILDECHNIVQLLHSVDPVLNQKYSELYLHLQTSNRIIGMSGTLIYGESLDLAYLVNLVSGKELLPFNAEEFRLKYTAVRPWQSFFRGHLTESMLLQTALPTYTLLFSTIAGAGLAALPIFAAATLSLPLINALTPVTPFSFRELEAEKFKAIADKYISFYDISELNSDEFPSKKLNVEEVAYNDDQFEYFLDFAQNSLKTDDLMKIIDDQSRQHVSINSTNIQAKMQSMPGAGRQIGNLSFSMPTPKFERILGHIRKAGTPQTVVYSNYFKAGIQAFATYLDSKGMSQEYAMLLPTASPSEQSRIIRDYNSGKTKILLLHPEITEGISLVGTRQMHILEPVLSNTALNQIIARTVRYRSHMHLPKAQRHVDVYLWKSTVPRLSIWTYAAKKKDWWKRYSELSDWSQWGGGVRQVDPFYDRKVFSPDSLAHMRLEHLDNSVDSLNRILKEHSIESAQA